jgi:hypothetical protein
MQQLLGFNGVGRQQQMPLLLKLLRFNADGKQQRMLILLQLLGVSRDGKQQHMHVIAAAAATGTISGDGRQQQMT